ncbi:hypothetical protein FNV43_RR09709 [Rhamnella rubrinervis]|uniref:Uncharacterized protein n=1 Tax=Rhamnella rubrinervis TaxID=2594499 RepID=A0A8K0MKL9_9ROSA|nr:hypothetical protein FNV43_RR09709 [Rhamnella rubrinervis]
MEAGSSVPVGGEADDVVMVDAPASNSLDPKNFELKDLLSTISEAEVERFRQFYEIPPSVTFKKPERREGPLQGCEGEIAVHTASLDASLLFPMPAVIRRGFARKWLFVNGDWEGLPAAGSKFRVPQGLVKVEWPALPTVGKNVARKVASLKAKTIVKVTKLAMKANLSDARLWNLNQASAELVPEAEEGSSEPAVVDAIKTIKARKRPASDPHSGGATNKSRKMVGSFSKSTTPFKSTSSTGVGAGLTPTSKVMWSQADPELSERYQGKCKMLEQSLNIKENEKLAAVTRAEVAKKGHSQIDKKYQDAKISLRNKDREVEGLKNANQELSAELDELRKEGNENVMLGYSIMRKAVARKFPDCNMIELDQLATEEARKGDQPTSTPTDEPLQVEAGGQDPPHANELAIRSSEAGPHQATRE